jgi:secreted trypsin-like serine protease
MKDRLKDEWGACTGSIINDRFVLTAAHCVEKAWEKEDIQVFLTTSCNKTATANGKPLAIKRFIQHEDYGRVGGGRDIALIELETPLEFTDYFRPVCLYNQKDAPNLFATGWGLTNFGFLLRESHCLLEAEMKQVPHDQCPFNYGIIASDYVMCAGGKSSICFGDSGGPLTTLDDGHVYQVGVTSFTNLNCQIIEEKPGAFERVIAHTEWIKQKTQDANWCPAPKQLMM